MRKMFINYYLFFYYYDMYMEICKYIAWDEEIQALPSMKVDNVLGKFVELMHISLHSGNIL